MASTGQGRIEIQERVGDEHERGLLGRGGEFGGGVLVRAIIGERAVVEFRQALDHRTRRLVEREQAAGWLIKLRWNANRSH